MRGVAFLIHIARSYKPSNQNNKCAGWHKCDLPRTPDEMAQARKVFFKATQSAAFAKELLAHRANKGKSKNSPLQKLSPTMEDDLICVRGQLKHSHLASAEKNPIFLPKDSHISLLLTRHHHEQVEHQGLIEGAIRAAGLWILGGMTLINPVLLKCTTCCKLREKLEEQRMVDLPPEQLKTSF